MLSSSSGESVLGQSLSLSNKVLKVWYQMPAGMLLLTLLRFEEILGIVLSIICFFTAMVSLSLNMRLTENVESLTHKKELFFCNIFSLLRKLEKTIAYFCFNVCAYVLCAVVGF